MPRIDLTDPMGATFTICTRQVETVLRAWFDEVLPYTFIVGRPGIDDRETYWPKIRVFPMWAWAPGCTDPDWFTDSRAINRIDEFPAKDGLTGLTELLNLRHRIQRDLDELRLAS